MSSTTSTHSDSAFAVWRGLCALALAALTLTLAAPSRAQEAAGHGKPAAKASPEEAREKEGKLHVELEPFLNTEHEAAKLQEPAKIGTELESTPVVIAAGAAALTTAAASPSHAGKPDDPALNSGGLPAPDARARTFLGYASPWTPMALIGLVVLVALLLQRYAPKKRRRIGRTTLLAACYVVAFGFAVLMHQVRAEGWSRRIWNLADIFEVLTIVDLFSIFLFDLVLVALRFEIDDIYRALAVVGIYALAFIGLIHRAGVNLSSIVATSAVVTAVLGLSLQATLANVIGGIALQIDDSINVGDWLQLRDGQQGRVKAIRWRSTILETRNWDTLIVPNSALLGEMIQVLGQKADHPRQHREWIYFHVDYRFPPEDVMRTVDDALQSAPIVRVANDPPPTCLCLELSPQGGSSDGTVTYGVRYWLTDQGIHDSTNSAVRVRVFAALKRAQIPLALPGTAVFVSHDDKEHQERKVARELAQRVSALEAIEMLQCLSNDERIELARRMRLAPFSRGEVITRQGAVAHWLYVLTKGEAEVHVKVLRAGQAPLEKLVTRLRAPEVFGEMGVMTGEPRTATVSAATDVECYRIDREMFHDLVKVRHELAESISAVMARRRVELQAVRDNLGPEERKGRVAAERSRILAGIQTFFGLDGEDDANKK